MRQAEAQRIAKQAMKELKTRMAPGRTLADIRRDCEKSMRLLGADSFWYWDIGAFIFAGEDTRLSLSGKEYATADRALALDEILTVDLSPQCDGRWGDYARTFVMEGGLVKDDEEEIENLAWRDGLKMERELHEEMKRFATPKTTFAQLYEHMNAFIKHNGFVNLDFLGNLGHTIERDPAHRRYIEEGNQTRLCDVVLFTFEPHIGQQNGRYGFKRENIYGFQEGVLFEV